MASKNDLDSDVVEYEKDGVTHWAARGSRAYRKRAEDQPAPAVVKAVAAPVGGTSAKAAATKA